MTVVFDDEALYTTLKVEAARTHRPAKDIVAEALCLLFESTPAERDAILDRLSSADSVPNAPASVERVLAELGLSREPRAL